MSSTPLFDAIAVRSDRRSPSVSTGTDRTVAAAPAFPGDRVAPAPEVRPAAAPTVSVPAPTSPLAAPVPPQQSALVPAALVTAIDAIPAQARAALGNEHVVGAGQLPLVEAVADALTRVVVDAVVHELERISRDGVVRG